MQLLIIKIQICFRVLFAKKQHWVILNIDRKNAYKMFAGKPFDVNVYLAHCRMYPAVLITKQVANQYDADDVTLMKAQFEGKMDYINSGGQDDNHLV